MKMVRQELGSALFNAVVATPIMISVLAIATDLSSAISQRETLQREADRLAIQAAQLLPDSDAAESYLRSSVTTLPNTTLLGTTHDDSLYSKEISFSVALEKEETVVHNVGVKVALRSDYDIGLDLFLPSPITIPISVASVAQPIPSDTVLIISDGSSLRPELNAPWGTPVDWPATGYFNCIAPRSKLTDDYSHYLADYQNPVFLRAATQSCYNQRFSPLKLAAISLSESLLASNANRVGVIFSPGTNSVLRGYQTIRHVVGEAVLESGVEFEGLRGGFPFDAKDIGEGSWSPEIYREQATGLGDESCALFDLFDSYGGYRYSLAQNTRRFTLNPKDNSPTDFPICGEPHRPYHAFTEAFSNQSISLRQTIYWHAARVASDGTKVEPNYAAAIRQAHFELLNSGSESYINHTQKVRGNSAAFTRKQIIILADRIPNLSAVTLSELTSAVSELCDSQIDLVVALWEGTFPVLSSCPTKQLFRVVNAVDADHMAKSVVPEILRLGRQVVIRQ